MKASRRVDEKDVGPSGLGRLHSVVDDRSGIRPFCRADDVDAGSLRPFGQLLVGCRAESIRARDQHSFALIAIIGGQFADGRGLADSVDADDENDRGTFFKIIGVLALFHLVADAQDQLLPAVRTILDPLVLHLLPQIVKKLFGGLYADIAHDHGFFQLLEELLADLLIPVGVEDLVHIVGNIGLGLTESLFQSGKKALFLILCHRSNSSNKIRMPVRRPAPPRRSGPR